MRSQVALKLVGTSEALAAEEPLAAERPLAGMPAKVGLQVARLAVHLSAAGNMAQVLLLLGRVRTVTAGRRSS